MSVSRRQVLSGGAVAGLAAATSGIGRTEARPRRRPNFLVLVSEDCGAQHLGVYGGRAHTPTIDRLAATGIRWTHAFSAAPVCAPSRFAMITGVAPESCAPANQMRAAGALPTELNGAGWTQFLRDAGYYCTNNAKEDYNAAGLDLRRTWDESSPQAHWRKRPPGAPFYAVFNPTMTHELAMAFAVPASAPPGVSTPYLHELARIHAVAPTPIVGGPTRPEDVRIPPYYPDTPTTRNDAATYLNQINQMDSELAFRLRELEKAGLADDTIVLYLSDHGGVLPRSKRFCYDSGLKIPLIARFGRAVPHLAPDSPGSTIDHTVCVSTDLAPTVLSMAGLTTPKWMHGNRFAGHNRGVAEYAFGMRNRMDERYDFVRTARSKRFRYIRNYMPDVPNGQHVQFMWLQAGYREWAVRSQRGALPDAQARFWRPRPAEELYDVSADPDETSNLVARKEFTDVLSRLRTALDTHLIAVNDNGFIPESDPAEGYVESRSARAYPLEEIMRIASLAIKRDVANLPTFRRELHHPNAVMRYWAASGLRLLGAAAHENRSLRAVLAAEPSAHVKLMLAEVLALAGDRSGVDHLAWAMASHPDGWVRLQAANALDRLGQRARPALPTLRRVSLGVGGSEPMSLTQTAATHTLGALEGWSAAIP
uniref:sulfatase-like hydrolase/transferase n=1 Tax=Gordonia sp. B7-2 TaxID=3420932 RepID=UPI003D8A11F4